MTIAQAILEVRFLLNDQDTNTDLQRWDDADLVRIFQRGLIRIRETRTDAMFDAAGALYAGDVALTATTDAIPLKQALIPDLVAYVVSQALLKPAGETFNINQSKANEAHYLPGSK